MPLTQEDCSYSIPSHHSEKFRSLGYPTLAHALDLVHKMYPEVNLEQLISMLKAQGKKTTPENLIDAAYESSLSSQGESLSSTDSEPLQGHQWGASPVTDSDSEDETKPPDEEERKKAIQQAKQRLRKDIEALKIECHYCHRKKATILLLPCAHLACCKYCLVDVRRCAVPRCKKVVRGTKEVFFV